MISFLQLVLRLTGSNVLVCVCVTLNLIWWSQLFPELYVILKDLVNQRDKDKSTLQTTTQGFLKLQ